MTKSEDKKILSVSVDQVDNMMAHISSEFEKLEGPLDMFLALIKNEHWEASKSVAEKIQLKMDAYRAELAEMVGLVKGEIEKHNNAPVEPEKEIAKEEVKSAEVSAPAQAPAPVQG